MKKKGIILFLLGALVGALLVMVVLMVLDGKTDWRVYAEEKIFPNAVLAITTIFGLYTAGQPVVKRFENATTEINKTVETGKTTQNSIQSQNEKIQSFDTRFTEVERKVDEGLGAMKQTVENVEQIVRIGFCNNEELVKKGYATEIGKVGKKNEQEEV